MAKNNKNNNSEVATEEVVAEPSVSEKTNVLTEQSVSVKTALTKTAAEDISEEESEEKKTFSKIKNFVLDLFDKNKPVDDTVPIEPDPQYVLQVNNLKKQFILETTVLGKPKKVLKAVDGVTLNIKPGKTLGIVGESGCGKTTLGRTILRLHEPTSGQVFFEGKDVAKLKMRELNALRPRMQIIFQDPYSSLSPRMPVGAIIGEAVKEHKIVSKAEYRGYILDIMQKCGLQPHYFDRYPHEFSGGQRQRICIARALAMKPSFVVCDEPVSALDVSIQAQIINLLKDIQEETGITYMFISHDLSVVEHISDEVGVMYLGTMMEYASKEQIFTNPLHPYTEALFSAVPVPDPHTKAKRIILEGDIPSPSNPPKGCKFHTRCRRCMEQCSEVVPEYKEVEEGHFVACHLY